MKKISIWVTDKQHEKLKACHKHTEATISEQVRRAIDKTVPSFPDFRQIECYKILPEFQTCVECKKKKSIKKFSKEENIKQEGFPFVYYSKCKECLKNVIK